MVKIGIKPLKKTALPIFLMFCDVELHQLLTTALLLTVCISIIFCHCKEPPPPPICIEILVCALVTMHGRRVMSNILHLRN